MNDFILDWKIIAVELESGRHLPTHLRIVHNNYLIVIDVN